MREAAVLVIAALVAACGGDPQPEPTISDPNAPVCDAPDEVCLEEPQNGFQLRSDRVEIAAGQDVEFCEIVAIPGSASDTFYVKGFESQMTKGSHHLIVNAIEVGSEDEGEYAVGDRFECFANVGFASTISLTGSQQPYNGYEYPEGIGKIVHGGQLVVLNYHYFNTSGSPIQAETAVTSTSRRRRTWRGWRSSLGWPTCRSRCRRWRRLRSRKSARSRRTRGCLR